VIFSYPSLVTVLLSIIYSGPNTTLPHPDADLSPNFILSYAGVSDERMMKKHRLSFLKKQRRTVSHGRINPLSEASNSNSNLSLLMSESEKKKMSPLRNSSTISLRISKDGDESLRSGSKRDDDETPPTSPDVSEHPRKSGLFSRFKRS
jgi:hypothetical protein